MDIINIEYFSLIANLGSLTIAGILYLAYIKNLRSQLDFKNDQLNVAKQNINLWKDKALELERRSPQHMEKVLSDRIRIREDEIARLTNDESNHIKEIEEKNIELTNLTKELKAVKEFGRGLKYYDPEIQDYKSIAAHELEIRDLGQVWVDSASLMICDPFHVSMPRWNELKHFPVCKIAYKHFASNKIITVENDDLIALNESDKAMSAKELEKAGQIERLEKIPELPFFPDTYIKGENVTWPKKNKPLVRTFINGEDGAGIAIGIHGDGYYMVKGEYYKNEIQRIFIDLY